MISGLVPVVAATLVLLGVLLTIRQKNRTDRKEQWWKRVQWAADAVASSDDRRRCLGMSMLIALIDSSPVVERDDARLLQAIIDQVDLSSFS
ncbi:hypothetical protein ACWEOZ_21490 [Actinoplanes sp. NPDC004185]